MKTILLVSVLLLSVVGGVTSTLAYAAAPLTAVSAASMTYQAALAFIALLPVLLFVAGIVVALSQRQAGRAARVTRSAFKLVPQHRVRVPRPPVLGLLACLLGGSVALAADTATKTDAFGPVLSVLWPYIFTAIAGFSASALAYASAFLAEKTKLIKSQRLQDALYVVERLTFQKVSELAQTSIHNLKSASEDGKLTTEEAKAAATTAIAEVWQSLPDAIKAVLEKQSGSTDAAQDQYVKPALENAVRNQPSYGISVSNLNPDGLEVTQDTPAVSEEALAEARARIGLIK